MKGRNTPVSPHAVRSWNPIADRYWWMRRRLELIVQERSVSSETERRLKITSDTTHRGDRWRAYLIFEGYVGVSGKVHITTRLLLKRVKG
jgi:hypothetical protein